VEVYNHRVYRYMSFKQRAAARLDLVYRSPLASVVTRGLKDSKLSVQLKSYITRPVITSKFGAEVRSPNARK